jgi:hypothetical protein
MYEQSAATVSKPLLVMLVFWLTIIFISFGLYAPGNSTVVASLCVSALAISGPVLLILEIYSRFAGLVHISGAGGQGWRGTRKPASAMSQIVRFYVTYSD